MKGTKGKCKGKKAMSHTGHKIHTLMRDTKTMK